MLCYTLCIPRRRLLGRVIMWFSSLFFFQAEDGIRDIGVTGVQTCALPICERDHAPRHTDREWRQVSVNHRECLGAAKCPFGTECFAELAREKAHRSHLIVTNHSLLAIDAVEGVPMIPEYDVVVIDEAHELTARVTQAATDELFAADVDRAAKRSQRHVEGDQADDLADAGDALRVAINNLSPGRIDELPDELRDALASVRDTARACLSAYPKGDAGSGGDPPDAGLMQAKGAVQEVFVTAERM